MSTDLEITEISMTEKRPQPTEKILKIKFKKARNINKSLTQKLTA